MVHGGKYSVGYNFKDNLCRGIIMIGVPNRPIGSYYVQMKKKFFKNNP